MASHPIPIPGQQHQEPTVTQLAERLRDGTPGPGKPPAEHFFQSKALLLQKLANHTLNESDRINLVSTLEAFNIDATP